MYNGIIVVKKEKHFTSFDVVAVLRGICRQKKIGHTGTLDPDAEGVLPVCLGNATKICEFLTDGVKEYRAEMVFGIVTDTQDTTGTVLSSRDTSGLTEEMVRDACTKMQGEIRQIPPMYSAKKVNGKKLVDLARKGIEVDRPARPVTIYELRIEEISLPKLTFTVRCSKGTYVRTICHDLGQILGCGGAMTSLLRTEASGFSLEDALTLDEIRDIAAREELEDIIRPVSLVFSGLLGFRMRTEEGDRILANGGKLQEEFLKTQCESLPPADGGDRFAIDPSGRARMLFSDGRFAAVYRQKEPGLYRPEKMFL